MRIILALALAIGLTACGGSAGPPAPAGSPQIVSAPPAVEQAASAICTAYVQTVRLLTSLGRAGRLTQADVTVIDQVKAVMDPACRGNITEASMAVITSAFNRLTGVQAAVNARRT